MPDENNPAPPTPRGTPFNYGADQPAIAGPFLNQLIDNPADERIFAGLVTDCSTNSFSCTVTVPLKTTGYGVPCLWLSSSINRFGGAAEFNPPEVGSVVAIYLMKGSTNGIVLGQLPSLSADPSYPGGGYVDPIQQITSFNENTGQVMSDMGIGGAALSGYQKQPNDVFPGESGVLNELGVGFGAMRTMAFLKGSELAKIEAFWVDDLLKAVGRNLDLFTGVGDISVRDDHGSVTAELGFASTIDESLGILGDLDVGFPIWRMRSLIGDLGGMKREFISMPDEEGNPIGLSEKIDDSTGLSITRTVAGGGLIKTKSIAVPHRVKASDDPSGTDAAEVPDVSEEVDWSDFDWSSELGDASPQIRDAIAWILSTQSNARINQFSGDEGDFELNQGSGLDPGNAGANTEEGGHYRGTIEGIDLSDKDPGQATKPRYVKINDAWIIVLPDGTISIRDGHASTFTMAGGHITGSASKDVNFIAGRNLNLKAGQDVNINGRKSVDVTAGQGQLRMFSKKSAFLHSESGGILISTNAPATASDVEALGEKKEIPGIVIKPHEQSDVTIRSRSTYVENRDRFLVGGWVNNNGSMETPNIFFEGRDEFHKVSSSSWQLGGSDYARMGAGQTVFETSGTIASEGDFYAPFGTVKVNEHFDTHQGQDFSLPPGIGYTTLSDRYSPFYNNVPVSGADSRIRRNQARAKVGVDQDNGRVSQGTPFDWRSIRGILSRDELRKVEFSMRTEDDYGSKHDDFSWPQQAWMREWSAALDWGDDAKTIGLNTKKETYCYPGERYWGGNKGVKNYEEVNVDQNGDPKPSSEMSATGGEVTEVGFDKLKRHP